VGKVGEEVVWESGVGALSVFELTKELPDPDDPAGLITTSFRSSA